MSVQAISWVLDHSEAKLANRLVLISIANHARKDGTGAWPSVVSIAEESHVSRRQAQRSIRELIATGELGIEEGAGPHGTHLYSLPRMSPGQIVAPDIQSPEGATNEVETAGSNVARTVIEPNRPITVPSSSLPETPNQLANRITTGYVERQPMSRFPAVAGIVRTALKAGHSEREIVAALNRLAEEGRSVTVETLRIEIEGLPAQRRRGVAALDQIAEQLREAERA